MTLFFNDKLDADVQVDAEEEIAAMIFYNEAYGEEACNELARRILLNVLAEFRPDLIEEEDDHA